jgi:hypothetical protein
MFQFSYLVRIPSPDVVQLKIEKYAHVLSEAEGSARMPPRGKRTFWGLGTQRLRAGLNCGAPTALE